MEIKNDQSFGIIVVRKSGLDSRLRGNDIDFLLLKSARTGEWIFSKGHAENDETELQTAIRELKEETGIQRIDIQDGLSYLDVFSFEKDGFVVNKKVKYFLGFTDSKEVVIQKSEILDYKWVNYEDALKVLSFEQARDILRKVRNDLDKLTYVKY